MQPDCCNCREIEAKAAQALPDPACLSPSFKLVRRCFTQTASDCIWALLGAAYPRFLIRCCLTLSLL